MTVQRPVVIQSYVCPRTRKRVNRQVRHFAKIRVDAKRGARKRTAADELFRRAA